LELKKNIEQIENNCYNKGEQLQCLPIYPTIISYM